MIKISFSSILFLLLAYNSFAQFSFIGNISGIYPVSTNSEKVNFGYGSNISLRYKLKKVSSGPEFCYDNFNTLLYDYQAISSSLLLDFKPFINSGIFTGGGLGYAKSKANYEIIAGNTTGGNTFVKRGSVLQFYFGHKGSLANSGKIFSNIQIGYKQFFNEIDLKVIYVNLGLGYNLVKNNM